MPRMVHFWIDMASSDLKNGIVRFIADPILNIAPGECVDVEYHMETKEDYDKRNTHDNAG